MLPALSVQREQHRDRCVSRRIVCSQFEVAVKLMVLSIAAAAALSATTMSHEYEPVEAYVPVLGQRRGGASR